MQSNSVVDTHSSQKVIVEELSVEDVIQEDVIQEDVIQEGHGALSNPYFICTLEDIERESGVCALLNGVQIAIFRTEDDNVFALDNYDPYCHAYVLSRGLLGETHGRRYVASPMYKQRFDLLTGECLDGVHSVKTFHVFTAKGQVYFTLDEK